MGEMKSQAYLDLFIASQKVSESLMDIYTDSMNSLLETVIVL